MSKQVISSTKITKSYQTSNISQNYNKNQKNINKEFKDSFPHSQNKKDFYQQITGQTPPSLVPINNYANNLDSSLGTIQQRSSNNQSICTCNKWKTDTNNTYNKTTHTGEGYCTCDDTNSFGCTCYKRNTNQILNNTLSSNEQNIFIQDGNSNIDFCTCDEKEKKIFSTTNSDYNENIQNVLTDEEINMNYICTCGKNHNRNTFDSSNSKKSQLINNQNKMIYSTNIMTTSNNEYPVQTTDSEEKIIRKTDIKKVIKEEINIEVIRKQVREKIKKELEEENEEVLTWNGENFVQVIERLQYLTAPPPGLSVQFLNDMMIKRTINRNPIQILIPIPDNYIQRQGIFQYIAEKKQEKEEERNINEDLCPENVDLLNISHAYSIRVPSFNNLEIEQQEMIIPGIPKPEIQQPEIPVKEPFIVENYSWDINPSERMWSGVMRPVRVNKIEIEVPTRPDWNSILEEEYASNLDVKAPRKEKIVKPKKEKPKKEEKKAEPEQEPEVQEEVEEEPEEEPEEEVEEIEEVVEVEDEVDQNINQERKRRKEERERRKKEKEKRRKERELKLQKKRDPKRFRKNKFTLTFKQNLKRFKTIDIGDNEIITLKAEKRILEPLTKKIEKIIAPSDKTNFILGGKGFDINKYKWNPVPFNALTFAIEKTKVESALQNIQTDRMNMPAANKRRQNWNLVNILSTESTINILTKQKILAEQRVGIVTTLGGSTVRKNWNDKMRQQKGLKLSYGPTKKWDIKICKEIDMFYEQEADEVIIKDDYNNVKGPEMRPVTATIIKVKDEDDSSSVASYDVFQHLIIKKSSVEIGFGGIGSGSGTNILRKGYELGGDSSLIKNRKNLELGFSGDGKGKSGFSYNYEFKSGNGGISGNVLETKGRYQIGASGMTSGMGLGMDIEGGSTIQRKDIQIGSASGMASRMLSGMRLGMAANMGVGIDSDIGKGNTNFKSSQYTFKASGPTYSKNISTQSKIITTSEQSNGQYKSGAGGNNMINTGVSMNKAIYGDLNANVVGESQYKFRAYNTLAEEGNQNTIKLRISNKNENEQKNQYDKTVKSLANQTNNLIGKVNGNGKIMIEKRKKIEFIREDPEPEQTNFLKI